MGVRHSKHDAFTNDLNESTSHMDDNGPPCFGGCLFGNRGGGSYSPSASSRQSSRHGSRHGLSGSRNNSGSALGSSSPNDDGTFGTPMPDTPEPVRRLRDAAMEKYYNRELMGADSFEEEKKSGGGSFGRMGSAGGGYAGVRSSRYGGLEKEASDMYLCERMEDEMRPQAGGGRPPRAMQNGVGADRNNAEIYDGPDAESKLYQKYELCEVLGVGSTSTCHRCVDLRTGASRACKIVDKREIDPKYQDMMVQFYTEIKALRGLQHPNIVRLFDVFIAEDKIYIIMELMSGGELFDYVVQKGTLTEEEASRIVRKVTSALVYMHSKNVIHRDMKPENLLLAHKPRSSHDIEVKIIDFGLSKILSDGTSTGSFLGTRGYLAPEMLQRRDYTRAVDAWALGVVVFVLLCGCLPFDDDCGSVPSTPDLRSRFTLRFPRWAKDLSGSAKDLLSHLLDLDATRRYTAEQAMEHPWVKGETASGDSLLQSPGRIRPSPGGRKGANSKSKETRDHVSQMVANRAIANAQIAARSPRVHVRKTSI